MAFEFSLLERIEYGAQSSDYQLAMNEEKLVDSVLDHLRKMLNVRQGSVETLPDYGLPDINSLAARFPNAIQELKKEIKACIEKYEPRLSEIKIDYISDDQTPFNFRYEITARLVTDDDQSSIWFETTLDPSGKAIVKG